VFMFLSKLIIFPSNYGSSLSRKSIPTFGITFYKGSTSEVPNFDCCEASQFKSLKGRLDLRSIASWKKERQEKLASENTAQILYPKLSFWWIFAVPSNSSQIPTT